MKGLFNDEVIKLSLQEKMIRVYEELVLLLEPTLLPKEEWEIYEELTPYKKPTWDYSHQRTKLRLRKTNSYTSKSIDMIMMNMYVNTYNGYIRIRCNNQIYKHQLKHLLYFKEKWEKLK